MLKLPIVFARRLGKGFTEYKVHRQRPYHLCRFEVNVGEVVSANKKRGDQIFCRCRSTDYVSLCKTKEIKDKAHIHSELEQLKILSKYKKTDFVKEREELQAEITELQMLVEDLRMQVKNEKIRVTKDVGP